MSVVGDDEETEIGFEPISPLRRAPAPVAEEAPVEFTPRRATYPERPARSSRRARVDTELGVTIAGAYAALGILAFMILAIWHAAGQPGAQRVSRVFAVSLLFIYALGLLMASGASIWLLVIAFRDKLAQGLLCLLVPCYAIYYIFSRWRETRGIFAMCIAPGVLLVLAVSFGRLVLGVAAPLAFVNGLQDRVNSFAPDLVAQADPARVAEAERLFRDYIQAINRMTENLSRLQPMAAGQRNRAEIQMRLNSVQTAALNVQNAENRAKAVKVGKADMAELRKRIGPEMRAAIIGLKAQVSRIMSLPGQMNSFPNSLADLDRALAVWESPDGGGTDAQLADHFPGSSSGGGSTPPESAPGGAPAALPPGGRGRGIPTFEAHYAQLRSQYGDSAVMLVLTGLPTNSDPSTGVTKRDVNDAIDKKLKVLAPGAHQSMSTASGDTRSICLAPVDNVQGLADAIDFGKATRAGSRIDVVVSKEYIASTPRLPAEPAVAARPARRREAEPQVPANADAVTKSLIELKSSDMFRRKQALERLARNRPNDRLKDVIEAVLPLLDSDEQNDVKSAAQVLAVWQSPEALAKLIERASDNRVFVRWDIIKALGKYDETKAAEALIGRLKEDGHQAEDALKTMGLVAEPPLIELLTNPDADLRKKACEVLKFVGGSETLKVMKSMRPDSEFFVRVAAQDAFKMITLRVGSGASDGSQTKEAGTQAPARSRKKA